MQTPTLTGPPTPTLLADDGISGLPTILLILFALIALALLLFYLAAVVSILRSDRLSSAGKGMWIVSCLILQFFGPLAWFIWGRHQSFDRRDESVDPLTRA